MSKEPASCERDTKVKLVAVSVLVLMEERGEEGQKRG
jgi:hypothetical protein